jgi:queuine/archaeosine tRNA-ribosyltransferase
LAIQADTLDYVIGDQMTNRFIPDYKEFQKESFIFSAYPFYKFNRAFNTLKELGIHTYANHTGPILIDSGGFQLIRKQIEIDPKDTLKIYEAAQMKKGDFGICLDYCPRAIDPGKIRMEKIRKTNDNYHFMVKKNPKVLHVIHGWTKKELETSISAILGTETITYGSCFNMMAMNSAFDELLGSNSIKDLLIKRFLIFLDLIKEKNLDENRIHILGASSGNSSHVMWFAGMDQMDSSNWRIKAAYGKISFPGITEVKISKRKSNFGANKWKPNYDKKLKECNCPICKQLSLNQSKEILAESFKARGVHNAWVYLQEKQLAKDMIGTPRYKRYLDKRFERSYFWKKFLKKIDESKHQKELSCFLKI